jgi:glycosyltransferase involved in cell wall biosynthesis
MNELPKVSVLVTTYNHERFIAQAVESALMQRTDFPFEIVVGEDCSTDRTREILLELQERSPQPLRLMLHENNIGGPRNVATVLAACRGEYVAMLEGDDYWTHTSKLQKQVDALDAHDDWSACFHVARMVFEDHNLEPRLYPEAWFKDAVTIDDLLSENMICTCSVMFRRDLLGVLPAWHQEVLPGDWAIHILNANRGPIGFLSDVMANYRVHAQGLWSGRSSAEQHAEVLRMLSRVDHHFQGKYTRQIDDYRIHLVARLATQCESLERHKQWLESRLRATEVVTNKQANGRSPTYELSRVVMRPLERIGKRVAAAAGIRLRAD